MRVVLQQISLSLSGLYLCPGGISLQGHSMLFLYLRRWLLCERREHRKGWTELAKKWEGLCESPIVLSAMGWYDYAGSEGIDYRLLNSSRVKGEFKQGDAEF